MGFFDKDLGAGNSDIANRLDKIVRISSDPVTVQIIEPRLTQANIIWRHYVPQALRKSGQRGVPVMCPGLNVCPICRRNKELGNDKNHPDYISPQKRIVVNVLDLTPVRTCPVCETANTPRAKECTNCGYTFTAEDRPVVAEDNIKLLERGVTLFTQLDMLEEAITTPYDPDNPLNDPSFDYTGVQPGDMVPVGITRFPITLTMSGSGSTSVITPVPGQVNNRDWRDYTDKLLDPRSAYMEITPEEISVLVAGGSLSDVFKARNSEAPGEIPF